MIKPITKSTIEQRVYDVITQKATLTEQILGVTRSKQDAPIHCDDVVCVHGRIIIRTPCRECEVDEAYNRGIEEGLAAGEALAREQLQPLLSTIDELMLDLANRKRSEAEQAFFNEYMIYTGRWER